MTTPRASAAHSRQASIAAQTPAPGPATPTLRAPPLPPADTFDFLPPLYGLLRRLQQPSGIDAPTGTQDGANATLPEGSPSQPLERTVSVGSGTGKLELSHLDTAASAIRLKIQKARQVVASMPDVDRTVEEQEEEIMELENRVLRQRAMLGKLCVNLGEEKASGEVS